MTDAERYLLKLVVVRTAQGEIVGVGRCLSYADRPTISVRTRTGRDIHWIADLCEVIEINPEVLEAIMPLNDHKNDVEVVG